MVQKLTDEKIARLFQLCDEISAVRHELPPPPKGFDVRLEQARMLRATLAQHNAALAELAELLQGEQA